MNSLAYWCISLKEGDQGDIEVYLLLRVIALWTFWCQCFWLMALSLPLPLLLGLRTILEAEVLLHRENLYEL